MGARSSTPASRAVFSFSFIIQYPKINELALIRKIITSDRQLVNPSIRQLMKEKIREKKEQFIVSRTGST